MKAKKKCANCDVDILFTKKDVRPLTKIQKRNVKESNAKWQKELDAKEKVATGLFGLKTKEQYKLKNFGSFDLRDAIKKYIINPIGIIKCPICNKEQYILESK